MIRIILKESAAKVSDWEYGAKHIRFLERIRELNKAILKATPSPPDSMFFAQEKAEQWLNVIESIRPLKTEHIIRAIGFGARGGAFLLTNGNILKVGLEKDNPSGDEALWIPRAFTSAQFKGKGSAAELHVYDSGQFYIPNSEYRWAWREVPIYTPFPVWAKNNIKEITNHDIWSVARMTDYFLDMMNDEQARLGRVPEFTKLRKRFAEYYSQYFPVIKKLGNENTDKLLKAIYSVSARRQDANPLDLHDENLGVDQHGNFVFFDF